MTVACIIQARLGSTRLPAKVLLPLPTGRTVLEEVLYRCRRIPGVDEVVLAIPDTPDNDILESLSHRWRGLLLIKVVRGSEHDILGRYLKAAHAVGAKTVMRITADCPLIDPDVCGSVLECVTKGLAQYASNVHPRSFPAGLDCEAFTMNALVCAASDAKDAEDREHVTPHMIRTYKFYSGNVHARDVGQSDRSHLRWTLDTLQDYTAIWRVMEQQMREAA